MSLPWNVNASMGGAGVNYQIQRSLRLRSSATAYLNKTFSSSGTDLRKWTLSFWMKRGALSVQSVPFSCQDTPGTGASSVYFLIGSGNTIGVFYPNTGANLNVGTAAVLRDPSAWYHVLFAFDTTQATSTDRIKIYINGVQQTLSGGGTYPTLNSTTTWNSNCPHFISKNPVASSDYFDGYFAEIYNIDGQALTPASFGYNDPVTGVWQPAPFKGTYGTNGFYLPFTDIATTSGSNFGLGRDYSGNANYWNTNNISVTAGATYDSMIDSPTSFSDGSTYYNRGNYCTWNPLNAVINDTINNGNLGISDSNSAASTEAGGTISMLSNKWYWEITQTANNNDFQCGVIRADQQVVANSIVTSGKYVYAYGNNGYKYENSSFSSVGTTLPSVGDILMIAYDADSGKIWYGKNGTWISSGNPAAGTNNISTTNTPSIGYVPYARVIGNTGAETIAGNFGQQSFTYTPPTGFKALNTFNLPTPTIPNGAAYMAATLWTGDGTTSRTLTNGGNNTIGITFQPDFVWIKERDIAISHTLFNSIVGAGANKGLASDTTDSESSFNDNATFGYLSAFNSNGFSVERGSSGAVSYTNKNAGTYVGWQWQAGKGTTSTNTSGSITSTVSANTTAGFSVVTWTYNSSGGTIGHGLGVAPSMILQKVRTSGVYNWDVYHISTGATKRLILNATDAASTFSGPWNNTSPTSSVFSSGASWYTNGDSMVSYCFAAVRGYSAFGSYTGNGSTDGPFVYTGFRPRFVLVKCSSNSTASTVWTIWDTSRNTYNASVNELYPNSSDAERVDSSGIDILSNGFKPKRNSEYANFSGWTYIYAAFAENPFNYSRAR